MQVVVLANDLQKTELAANDFDGVVWVQDERDFLQFAYADAYIDLEYFNSPERNAFLAQFLPALVVVNSVTDTLSDTNKDFVRINGWPTFLLSPVLEGAAGSEEVKAKATEIFAQFNKKVEWLADEPGFVTARVVSMIVNEAYLALGEGVSTEAEINTAMKLGTAYPYGPFEWAEKIGLQNIVTLLQTLSKGNRRYTPAELLLQETDRAI